MTDRELQLKSIQLRKKTLEAIYEAGAGHTGGGLSCLDILNVLYNRILNVSPETFSSPTRDRYVQSEGCTPAGPLTYGRITTADADGKIRAYVGEGELTNDKLDTFGNRAVAKIPRLQKLMHHVCKQGFEHHVVMTQSKSAGILAEAFGNYFGWEVHQHEKLEE